MGGIGAAVSAAMKELGEGVAQNEPRRRVFAPGGLLNVMFATYPGGRCTGLKAYSVADGHVRFLVVLFGLDGSLEALIEADFMGSYRTGAATAVAVRALGPRGPARGRSDGGGVAGDHAGSGRLASAGDQGAAGVQPGPRPPSRFRPGAG